MKLATINSHLEMYSIWKDQTHDWDKHIAVELRRFLIDIVAIFDVPLDGVRLPLNRCPIKRNRKAQNLVTNLGGLKVVLALFKVNTPRHRLTALFE